MKLFCDIINHIHTIQNNSTLLNPISSIIITMFYNNFINNELIFTTRNKFDYLSTILHNELLLNDVKKDFICVFCNSQKVYWILSRFIRRIKNRKIIRHH